MINEITLTDTILEVELNERKALQSKLMSLSMAMFDTSVYQLQAYRDHDRALKTKLTDITDADEIKSLMDARLIEVGRDSIGTDEVYKRLQDCLIGIRKTL